jgi:hypothetical protein
MQVRFLCGMAALSAIAAATSFPLEAVAVPAGTGASDAARVELVQKVGRKYSRRYDEHGDYVRAPFTEVDTRRGTWVAAPFARVYSGRRGTWVRAPFVNLWVPR